MRMFQLWIRSEYGWQSLSYSPAGREVSDRRLAYYQSQWPDREYAIAPAGFNPDLQWVG